MSEAGRRRHATSEPEPLVPPPVDAAIVPPEDDEPGLDINRRNVFGLSVFLLLSIAALYLLLPQLAWVAASRKII